jgi:hypothetical protein
MGISKFPSLVIFGVYNSKSYGLSFKSFEQKKVEALENNFPTMYCNSNWRRFDHFVEHFKGWE